MKISNEIFDFTDDIVESRKNLQILNKPSINIKQQNFLIKTQNEINNDGNNEKAYLKMIINFLNQKNWGKLKLDLKSFLVCFLRKPFEKAFFSIQKILKEEAFFEINKRLDVVNLLRKLNDIEKLKTLLLTDNQKILFDIPSKTKLTLSQKLNESTLKFKKKLTRREISKERKKTLLINETMNEMKKNYEAFMALQDEKNWNGITTENFNDKILKLVDKGQLAIFNEMKKKEAKLGFIKTKVTSLEKAKRKL